MFAVSQLNDNKNVYMTNSQNMHQTKRHTVYKVPYGNGGFRGSVGTGILWGFPQVFLLVWDG